METYYLVLCFVVFTAAASFSSVDAIPEYADDSLKLSAQGKSCNCENGRCFTDKEGHTKCACKPGFALQDEFTCKSCDCGSLGKCIFVLKPIGSDQFEYQKKCVCDVGRAEENGICVDCDCGENSACDFDHGERRCYCVEGYSEKDGVCTRCDCGFYGKCSYQNGNKKCECDEGYLELNGVCEECDCGDHGACSFENGQKTCSCHSKFSVNNGKCETCDCGSNSEYCRFVDGVKQCKCKDKYADRYGTCEECNCGANSGSCNFNDNQKTCSCEEGYVQKGEACQLGCSTHHPCRNGGFCKQGFCFCQNGTRGEFCEVIDECSTLCPNQGDIQCSYDAASHKAYCRCLNSNLRYDPNTRQCRGNCQTDNQCINGVCRNGMCKCLPGFAGDRCEIVDCVTNAIRCQDQNYLLWRGNDILYVLWKGILMKYVRQNVVLPYVTDCRHGSVVRCNYRYDYLWCHGGNTVYVPTPQNRVLWYRRVDSTGARCGSTQARAEPQHQIEKKSEFKKVGLNYYVNYGDE